jgi:hypothetical protein
LLTTAGVKCGYSKSFAAAPVDEAAVTKGLALNALFVGFLLSSTAILSVFLGIFGAYCAIHAVLSTINPSRPSNLLAALVPHQSEANGD